MAWTDERIELLTQMWNQGYNASQISEELGGVSRNAVIGKAHRLGLESRVSISPSMLAKVSKLKIGNRTQRLIANDNIVYVGDLIQRTEAEFLRMPDFGRKSLDEVKTAVAGLGLRLGMWLPNWPPADLVKISTQWETARRVSELKQARGGATFQPVGDRFAMATVGGEDDRAAALQPMNQQIQAVLLQKARAFGDVAARLDNQLGWSGIGRTAATLAEYLNRDCTEIPQVLGYLYPAAIELGSFAELDQQLAAGIDSYAAPLDPEVRRPLSDLVRTLAPWLRAFPSVRELDDEANRFLVRAAELTSTFDIVTAAGNHELLSEPDLAVFYQLKGAISRGKFQGDKAGWRAKLSASNLVLGVVTFLATAYTGAIGSVVASNSPLAEKAGEFIVSTEKSIESLANDLPNDSRFSILQFLKDVAEHPIILPNRSRLPSRADKQNLSD